MGTKKLQDIFKESSNGLRENLSILKLPKDYDTLQTMVSSHIKTLLSSGSVFWSSLNKSDAEILNSALKMSTGFQKLTLSDTINYQELSKKIECEPANEEVSVISETMTLLPTAICAFISPWLACAIAGATVGYRMYNGVNKKSNQQKVTEKDLSTPIKPETISAIINAIEEICVQVDNIILKNRRNMEEIASKYDSRLQDFTLEKKFPHILSTFQYILADKNIPTDTLVMQKITMSLKAYGYKVVDYSPELESYFTKQPKGGISEPEMYLPAILKENGNGLSEVSVEGVIYVPDTI